MAMSWGLAVFIINIVWVVLDACILSCLTAADELARDFRTGNIGYGLVLGF